MEPSLLVKMNNIFFGVSAFKKIINKMETKPYKYVYRILPRNIRRSLKYSAELSQQKYIANKWKLLIELYSINKIDDFNLKAKQEFKNKKIIWQYWGKGWNYEELPLVVKLCYKSVEKHKGDYHVIRLDDNNIGEYLDLPPFIYEKRKNPEFKYAFFSDLLRLALLKCYGGIWLDATILLTDNITNRLIDSDLFLFHRNEYTQNKEKWIKLNQDYFSWHKDHRICILNSIIFSEKDNNIISTCLELLLLFWKTQNSIPHYFFFQILFDELQRTYSYTFSSQDDTFPHLLQICLKQKFDQREFEKIKSICNTHKLTYVNEVIPNSYYRYLLDEYLVE